MLQIATAAQIIHKALLYHSSKRKPRYNVLCY